MPRSSGSDIIPQRHSRRGPRPQRTSSSDSDPLHHRPVTETSRRLGERRSQRAAPQPDTLNQKKLGTRISDLESQLVQAQQELKNLKEQLAFAEAAKKEAQQELESKNTKPTALLLVSKEVNAEEADKSSDNADDNRQETDVFEVPIEKKVVVKPTVEPPTIDQVEKESKSSDNMSAQPQEISEPEKSPSCAMTLKDDEINMLKAKLEEKATESEAFRKEKEDLETQLQEAISNISSAKSKEENISLRLTQLEEEEKARKENESELKEKLEASEAANEQLKAEMKKMRVQTEQWRKAADAAAAVLAGNEEMNGRISGRCGSMDKHFTGGMLEAPTGGGYPVFVGSPGIADDLDDGLVGRGRRKGSGMKVFGDLWKKKSHK